MMIIMTTTTKMTMMMMMLQISSLLQHVDFGDSDAMIVVYTGERSDVVGE